MKNVWLVLFFLAPLFLSAQDITGTWEGELIKDGGATEGIQRTFKIKWEIVQVEKEVYGIVYFYPQDTKPNDKPNSWYTWYGKQGKSNPFPFQFIQGRYIDGFGTSSTYQFNVKFERKDSTDLLTGTWYYQLESLNSRERPAGFYSVKRISKLVSDQLWLKRKEKEIIEKIESRNKTYSR